jgi:hypothetical protein
MRERLDFPDNDRPQRKNRQAYPLRFVISRPHATVASPCGRRRWQWTDPIGPRRPLKDASANPTLLRTAFRATGTPTARSSPDVRIIRSTGPCTSAAVLRSMFPLPSWHFPSPSPIPGFHPLYPFPKHPISYSILSLVLFLFPISFP